MIEKQSSLRKLKKSHVLQNVLKQIKDDTGKLWRSARSLTGTDDEEHGHDHEHEHDPNHNPSPAPEHPKSVPPTIDTKLMEGNLILYPLLVVVDSPSVALAGTTGPHHSHHMHRHTQD
jgi:hypothetical protein